MTKHQTIFGVGDLTYDHVFEARGKKLHYICSRGGGSVFNLLANIAHLGGSAAAAGVGGADVFGEAAKAELQHLSINTSNLNLIQNKSTLIVFEQIQYDRQELWLRPQSRMSMTCQVCDSRALDQSLARIDYRATPIKEDWSNTNIACFDRLTTARVDIARRCREQGILTALDLGRSDFIRFIPASQVIASLSAFDVAVVPLRVALSLVKRTGLASILSLASIGPSLFMFVTKGEKGLTLYDNRRRPKIESTDFPATLTDTIIDETGAGDAFFAHIIWGLNKCKESINRIESITHSSLLDITRTAITSIKPVLDRVGARGHIPIPSELISPIDSHWQGLTVDEIKGFLKPGQTCPFCNSNNFQKVPRAKHSKATAKKNISKLADRMLFAVERRGAVEKCIQVLKGKGTAYTIGTGGSYPVAVFLSLLFNEHSDLFSQPIRPFDYIRMAKKSDFVVVISYSGTTTDCAEAIRHAIKLGVNQIVLVTGARDPELKQLLRLQDGKDILISYSRPLGKPGAKERGFVSISGTVAPCALWTAAVLGPTKIIRLVQTLNNRDKLAFYSNATHKALDELMNALKMGKTLAVIGGGFSWPAMLDLESKFVEAGLGNLQLHEEKDFSHGRFISVMGDSQNKDLTIVLHLGQWNNYEKLLINTLFKDRTVIVLSSEEQGLLGALDLLIKIQYFAQISGGLIDKDISRPNSIPKEGLELYRWSKGLE